MKGSVHFVDAENGEEYYFFLNPFKTIHLRLFQFFLPYEILSSKDFLEITSYNLSVTLLSSINVNHILHQIFNTGFKCVFSFDYR